MGWHAGRIFASPAKDKSRLFAGAGPHNLSVDDDRDRQENDLERSFAMIDIEYLLVQRGQAVRACLFESGHQFEPATFVVTALFDLLSGMGLDGEKMLEALDEFGRAGLLDRAIQALCA